MLIVSPFKALIVGLTLAFPMSAFAQSIDEAIGTLAEKLGAQLGEEGTERLAVFSFSELNGFDSALGDFVSEELTTALFGVGEFQVVERNELDRVISEHELYSSEIFDSSTIAELGQFLAIDALITGSITRFDESVRVNSRAIDITTGRVFAAAAITFARDGMVNSLLNQSSRNSYVASRGDSGAITQSSEVVFENDFLRIVPTAVILSDDRSSFTVTTEFQNLTSDPLLVTKILSHPGYIATTKHGDEFGDLDISTLYRVNSISRNDPSYYTRIEPNSNITVVWRSRTENRRSMIGDRLVLRGVFSRYVDGGGEEFSVQLDNIVLD